MIRHSCDHPGMDKTVLLKVLFLDLQAGFKHAVVSVGDFKTAKCGKTLNKIFFLNIQTSQMTCLYLFTKGYF